MRRLNERPHQILEAHHQKCGRTCFRRKLTAHMLRFLRNLKNDGFSPQTVISDRSPLYPKAIAEVWPDANHQLCVFHVISEVNDHVLNAVGEIRRTLKPKRIKQGRGRPSKRNRARVKKLKKQREQADRLFRRRHLLVTKKSNLRRR